jgi:hypothetical protein
MAVLHLGGVFEEHPSLRISGERECVVTFEQDKQGRDCMVISVGNGAVKGTRRSSRTESQTTKPAKASGSQAAAAKVEEPKTETE